MSNVAIIDTGYPNTSKSGDIATTRVNSGSAINLDLVDIKITRGGGTDDSPSPSAFSDVVVSRASSENQKIVISGIVAATSAGATLCQQIDQLTSTPSVKLLYYTGTTTTAPRYYMNPATVFGSSNSSDEHCGESQELTDGTYHLHVQFEDAGFVFDAKGNLIRFTLQGMVTA